MRLENYSVAAFEDLGAIADEPAADLTPSTLEAAPLPETPSTLLSEMAQRPPVFTLPTPPAPVPSEAAFTDTPQQSSANTSQQEQQQPAPEAAVVDTSVKPLASAAQSPAPAAPTWQGMSLPSAAASPSPRIDAEGFARMEAASSMNSGGGGSSFGSFGFGGFGDGGGGDVESWDYSFEGVDGAPDVNISVTYQGETPISSQTTTTLADSGADVGSLSQQFITLPAPVDTSGIGAELPSWSDNTAGAADGASDGSNAAGERSAANGGTTGSAPQGGMTAAATESATSGVAPASDSQQTRVVGTNGSGQDIRAVGSYQPQGAIRVVDDAPVLQAGDPNIVGDATGATPMRDEAGTLLYRIDGGKDDGRVRQLLPAQTAVVTPQPTAASIPAVDAMGNVTGYEQPLDTGESSPDPVLIQQMAGGLTGAVRSIAKGADAAVRMAGNAVIQIGDIVTLGVNHDHPFIQQAWIEQGALAHDAVRLVTEPSAVWDDVTAGFSARSDAADRLRAQGRYFDAAVIDGEMAADVSQVVIGAAGAARATVRGGAAALESLGAEGNAAARARVPVTDRNLPDADLANVYERQTQTRLPAGGAAIKAETANAGQAASPVEGNALKQELARLEERPTPDNSRDAYYRANTDQSVLVDNAFDMDHVLAGEVKAKKNGDRVGTGYHAELSADGSSRISPGTQIQQNPNGTYEAKIQIFDEAQGAWVDKAARSTFFPPEWSMARIEYEVSEAFKIGEAKGLAGTSFREPSPSGVVIQFHWDAKNQRTTFYPIGN